MAKQSAIQKILTKKGESFYPLDDKKAWRLNSLIDINKTAAKRDYQDIFITTYTSGIDLNIRYSPKSGGYAEIKYIVPQYKKLLEQEIKSSSQQRLRKEKKIKKICDTARFYSQKKYFDKVINLQEKLVKEKLVESKNINIFAVCGI